VDSLTTTPENDEAAAPTAGREAGGSTLKAVRIAMAALWTLVILFLCWMPGKWVKEVEGGSPWFQIPDLDKVIHWGIFVLFTILWLRTGTSRWRYAWVALAGLALAAITELVQSSIPAIGRDGEIGDAITDLIGVAIGLAIFRWIEPLLRRAESVLFRAPGA
jgi:VanZ like family